MAVVDTRHIEAVVVGIGVDMWIAPEFALWVIVRLSLTRHRSLLV